MITPVLKSKMKNFNFSSKSIFKKKLKLKKVVTIFVAILGLVAIYFAFQGEEVKAAWFNESWMYRQQVAVTNSGSAQTDFQIQITLDTATLISAGKMQSDCDDVRFTNINGKLLPYFQNTACNATKTRYWVKVNSIPTPSVTIYIYYGNPNVPAGSKRNETFDLSYLGTFSQIFSDANIASNHGASSDRENNFYISQSTYVNRFNTSWAYQQQYSALDIYTGLCYDDKLDRFYGIDWTNKQWSAFTTSFVETSPLDQALGDQPIDCATDSTYVYTNHRTGLICRNRISDNNKECIDMDTLSGFDWGGQGLTYTFGYLFAGTTVYGDNDNRIYMIDIDDWSDPKIVTYWDASGHTLTEVAGLTWKDKYIYQTSRSEDGANEWQGPLKVAATEPSVGSPTNEEQSPGPVAYWKFDEGYETTAYDSTQNANNGILTNGPTWKSEDLCMTGKCIYFDGADDEYVKTSSSVVVPNEATLAVWIRATAANQVAENIYPFGFYQVSLLGPQGINDTRSGLIARKDSTNTYWDWGSQNLYDGKWHYYVVTWDTTNLHLYIDGVEIGSPKAINSNIPTGESRTINAGTAWSDGGYGPHTGFLDEVKIYPYARSAAEIKADYLSGSAGIGGSGSSVVLGAKPQKWLSDGLIGYWKMDESLWDGTPGEVIDSSGSSNNGTSTNANTTSTSKFGNGGYFDGDSDYVEMSDDSNIPNGTADRTITAWVKVNSFDNGRIFSYGVWTQDNAFDLIARSGDEFMVVGHTNNYVTTKSDFSTSVWYYITAVLENGNLTFYYNGIKDSTQSTSINTTLAGDFRIGNGITGRTTDDFDGVIDEVRFYNRALSFKEVRDLYNWAPGPVAEWKFDEKTGTIANDTSGNGNKSITFSTPDWTRGKYGSALSFDDNNSDYIEIADSSSFDFGTGDFTYGAWVKTTKTTDDDYLISFNGSTDIYYRMQPMGEGRVFIRDSGGDDCYRDSISSLNDGEWRHFAFTWEGSTDTIIIYIDGAVDQGSLYCDVDPVDSLNAGSNLFIGQTGAGGSYYTGEIDHIRIYNYARTAKQIVEDMNAGHPAVGSPAGSYVGYWKFDEGYGDTAYDSSIYNNGGNLAGACPGAATCPAWSNEGKFNKALSFDGGDYVSLGSADHLEMGTGSITLSLWVKANSFSGYTELFYGSATGGNHGYGMMLNSSGEVRYEIYGSTGGRQYVTSDSITTDKWYHLVMTFDHQTNQLKLYINGEKNKSNTLSDPGDVQSPQGFIIGSHAGTSYYFDGFIDEIKIYPFALTEDEVKLDYNRGASVVLGALSTDSSGNPSNSSERSHCPPGDTTASCSPVAEWKFDEKTGTTTNDTSGNENTGTLVGSPIWKSAGECKQGACLNFDGINDYVDCGTSLSFTDALTIETWVKLNDLGDGGIVGKYSNWGHYNYALWYESNQIYFEVGNKGTDGTPEGGAWETKVSSNIIDTPGQWYHVVGSYDKNKVKLFVNAIEENSADENRDLSTGAKVCVGSVRYDCVTSHGYNETNSFFDGLIDGMRIYNYARTQAQVAWSYNRGNPVGWWKLDECQATTTYDSSGNGNNGIITIGGTGSQDGVGTCADVDSTKAWYNGRNGKYNYSLSFDGTDDFVSIGNPSELNITDEVTLSAWLKSNEASGSKTVVSRGYAYMINAYYSSGVEFYGHDGTDSTSCTLSWDSSWTNNWILLTAVIRPYTSGWTIKGYVNGVEKCSGTNSNFDGPRDASESVYIGSLNGTGRYQDGQIDDVRIYNYALTEEQIKNVMNQGAAIRFGPD